MLKTRRLNLESLENRLLFVVAAFDPSLLETSLDEFTGVADLSVGCTATLLPTGRHLLTAAHCFSGEQSGVVATFETPSSPSGIEYVSSNVHIHPVWDARNTHVGGDGGDIAIVELSSVAARDIKRYDIYRGTDELEVADFELVGYGRSGTGDDGIIPGLSGTKRAGRNRFESFPDPLNGVAIGNTDERSDTKLAFDFDNGLRENDAFGTYLGIGNGGEGEFEAGLGGGDSGGPAFFRAPQLNGFERKIAGVSSSLILSPDSDVNPDVPSTFGETFLSTRVSSYQCWVDRILAGNTDDPAHVAAVAVGSTLNDHADYFVSTGYFHQSFAPSVPARQLGTVPVGRPNQIRIRFSESVDVSESSLSVVGRTSGTSYHDDIASFEYNDTTFEATWTFGTTIGGSADQVALTLSNVVGADGQNLDGEWLNPTGSDAKLVWKFPSGNGCADDSSQPFEFNLNFIAADFNRDTVVDGGDFNVWNANKFTAPQSLHFIHGDGSGNDSVGVSDFNLWNQLKFTDFTTWDASAAQSGTPDVAVRDLHFGDGDASVRDDEDSGYRDATLIDDVFAFHGVQDVLGRN